eukprot:Amastigsp_a843187_21.p3 type:complete len:136 gc:universal Amastigsp_a843187_21:458-51(-)
MSIMPSFFFSDLTKFLRWRAFIISSTSASVVKPEPSVSRMRNASYTVRNCLRCMSRRILQNSPNEIRPSPVTSASLSMLLVSALSSSPPENDDASAEISSISRKPEWSRSTASKRARKILSCFSERPSSAKSTSE